MKICTKCQFENKDEFRFCTQCGNDLSTPVQKNVCSICSTVLEGNMKFCPQCGGQAITVSYSQHVILPADEDEPVDYEALIAELTEKAEKGDAEAAYELGTQYYNAPFCDYAKAVEWLTFSAIRGNADAQFDLGLLYFIDNGLKSAEEKVAIPQNDVKAFSLFNKSAQQGHPEAQMYLGSCYMTGTGTDLNEGKGFFWYQKAAEQNNPEAQYELGQCYYFGKGVRIDPMLAKIWNHKSALQGNDDAIDFEIEAYGV